MARASRSLVRMRMSPSHAECALQDETTTQLGARADEPRGGHDEPLGKMSGEPGHEVPPAAEGGGHLLRIAGEVAGEQGFRGEASAADRRTDALAGDVPREAGRVPDEG